MIGDRIAAATYLCAVGAAGGEIVTTGVDPDHLTAVLCALQEAGCRVETGAGEIRLTCYSPLRAIRPVRTAPHPGFPTDAQAILMAAPGRRDWEHYVCGEHLFQPLPPCR